MFPLPANYTIDLLHCCTLSLVSNDALKCTGLLKKIRKEYKQKTTTKYNNSIKTNSKDFTHLVIISINVIAKQQKPFINFFNVEIPQLKTRKKEVRKNDGLRLEDLCMERQRLLSSLFLFRRLRFLHNLRQQCLDLAKTFHLALC